jgi:hypothetical protein
MITEPVLSKAEAEILKNKLMAEKEQREAFERQFPEEPFSPLKFTRLPAKYNMICIREGQIIEMETLAKNLRRKHPGWKDEKLMRKVFESFPTVKIQIKKDEQSIPGTGEETASGDNSEDSNG